MNFGSDPVAWSAAPLGERPEAEGAALPGGRWRG
jgi:hypothetical protein